MENSQNESKSWFSELNWKTAIILAAISIVAGGGTGAGVVASKAVQAEGLNKDQADVRYLTKDEAKAWREARDRQQDEIKKSMVTKEIFDERTKTIMQQNDSLRQELKEYRDSMERIMSNRK